MAALKVLCFDHVTNGCLENDDLENNDLENNGLENDDPQKTILTNNSQTKKNRKENVSRGTL